VSGSFLDFPFDIAPSGSARLTDEHDHLTDLVMQILFTEPGERMNLPEFGCGVKRLVFAGNNDALRAATQFLITQNMQRWLGDRISVERVDVSSLPDEEHIVQIDIVFSERTTASRRQVSVRV